MAEWKEIAGYEGLYLISNEGEIVALPKTTISGKRTLHRKAKPLKKGLRGHDGLFYEFVALYNGEIRKAYSVHRLVAEAFIPNPENLPEVNHKDENPLNNSASNLEWCTRQYNTEYSKAKPIEQLKDGGIIAKFVSIVKASETTGISRRAINNALVGRSKTSGGYEWRYC